MAVNTDKDGKELPNTELTTNSRCPKCGSDHVHLADYDLATHTGKVRCSRCGTFVRLFDAG